MNSAGTGGPTASPLRFLRLRPFSSNLREKKSREVHDEIIVSVDQAEKSNALKLITETMSTPPAWAPDLPVACEAGVGSNYGEVK